MIKKALRGFILSIIFGASFFQSIAAMLPEYFPLSADAIEHLTKKKIIGSKENLALPVWEIIGVRREEIENKKVGEVRHHSQSLQDKEHLYTPDRANPFKAKIDFMKDYLLTKYAALPISIINAIKPGKLTSFTFTEATTLAQLLSHINASDESDAIRIFLSYVSYDPRIDYDIKLYDTYSNLINSIVLTTEQQKQLAEILNRSCNSPEDIFNVHYDEAQKCLVSNTDNTIADINSLGDEISKKIQKELHSKIAMYAEIKDALETITRAFNSKGNDSVVNFAPRTGYQEPTYEEEVIKEKTFMDTGLPPYQAYVQERFFKDDLASGLINSFCEFLKQIQPLPFEQINKLVTFFREALKTTNKLSTEKVTLVLSDAEKREKDTQEVVLDFMTVAASLADNVFVELNAGTSRKFLKFNEKKIDELLTTLNSDKEIERLCTSVVPSAAVFIAHFFAYPGLLLKKVFEEGGKVYKAITQPALRGRFYDEVLMPFFEIMDLVVGYYKHGNEIKILLQGRANAVFDEFDEWCEELKQFSRLTDQVHKTLVSLSDAEKLPEPVEPVAEKLPEPAGPPPEPAEPVAEEVHVEEAPAEESVEEAATQEAEEEDEGQKDVEFSILGVTGTPLEVYLSLIFVKLKDPRDISQRLSLAFYGKFEYPFIAVKKFIHNFKKLFTSAETLKNTTISLNLSKAELKDKKIDTKKVVSDYLQASQALMGNALIQAMKDKLVAFAETSIYDALKNGIKKNAQEIFKQAQEWDWKKKRGVQEYRDEFDAHVSSLEKRLSEKKKEASGKTDKEEIIETMATDVHEVFNRKFINNFFYSPFFLFSLIAKGMNDIYGEITEDVFLEQFYSSLLMPFFDLYDNLSDYYASWYECLEKPEEISGEINAYLRQENH